MKKADKPVTGLRGFFTFSIGDKGYIGTGTYYSTNTCFGSDTGCFTNSFFEYNPQTDSWSQKASLPKIFKYGSAISINGKGYAGLGESSTATPQIGWPLNYEWFEYNPNSNSWISLSSFDVSGGGVSQSSLSAIGNEIYAYGGGRAPSGQPYNGYLRKYNITTNQWAYISTLGHNRFQTAGFYKDNKIYVAGGFDGIGEIKNDLYKYNTNTNQWNFIDYTQGLYNPQNVAIIGNKLYTVGGRNTNSYTASSTPYYNGVLEYNLDTKVWTQKANYPAGERGYVITHVYNNQLFAFGGWNANGGAINTVTNTMPKPIPGLT